MQCGRDGDGGAVAVFQAQPVLGADVVLPLAVAGSLGAGACAQNR